MTWGHVLLALSNLGMLKHWQTIPACVASVMHHTLETSVWWKTIDWLAALTTQIAFLALYTDSTLERWYYAPPIWMLWYASQKVRRTVGHVNLYVLLHTLWHLGATLTSWHILQ